MRSRPDPGALAALLLFMAFAIAVVFIVLGTARVWSAGSSEKWGHDPATSQWFRNLRSPRGFPCCDYADGTRIEDPDYMENDDGSYEVNARGGWVHIDKERVVDGTNRVGYAILWWGMGSPQPYCFLPGSRG